MMVAGMVEVELASFAASPCLNFASSASSGVSCPKPNTGPALRNE